MYYLVFIGVVHRKNISRQLLRYNSKAPQDQQVYEASYQEAISSLAQEQLGKKRRDEYRDGSIRIPIPSNNP